MKSLKKFWLVLATVLYSSLFLHGGDVNVLWSTYDWYTTGATDPDTSTKILKGLNAAGASSSSLYPDQAANEVYDGDLIELGFFKLSDGTASTVAYKGVWTPLTSMTTIGHNAEFLDADSLPSTETSHDIPAGEFSFWTSFTTSTNEPDNSANALSNPDGGDNYAINADQPTSLATNVAALNTAAGSGSPLLGIRFYDLSTGSEPTAPNADTAPQKGTAGTVRYNTIMDAAWVWSDDSTITMLLNETNGNVNNSVTFEFDNTSARSTDTSKIGTGDNQLVNDDYVATITYQDGSTALNLADGGIGSTILSGFDGSGAIYGANNANVLTIHSATGNDGAEAFLHSGDYYNASGGTAATDLTIIKTGGGTQVLTGNLKLADSSPSNESAYVSIEGGSIEFDAASGKTQIIEYLKGSTGTLILDNSGRADQTLEFGFAQSHSAANATFSGAVTLQGSNTKNTIKVSTGTTSDDYANEQVLSGVISGGEVLVKDGVGILTLEGNNANTGGVEINNGTLKVGNSANNADVGSGTVTINKGKFEVLAGDTIANQIVGGTDATKKSVLGGDGTFSYTTGNGIVVGSDDNEIDVISPGQGISSSFTETSGLSNQQITQGTDSAAAAMGDLSISKLTINDGAIFDWEINDFSSSAGTGWDVLRFGSLVFDSDASASGLINIFSVANDGTAGAVSNMSVPANGVLFLDSINDRHDDINWGGISGVSSGSWQEVDWMGINDNGFSYHNDQYGGAWNVWYNGSGDFYLRYSAVPEPSTYIMVTGLLMLPGFRMFRRFMKKAKSEDSSVDA
ncbi:MAG: hypothetical protein HN553_11200 [Opitutae bacterium]|nr:hypothetical protein [Opitutae bacterium]